MAIKDTTRKPYIEDNDENIFIGIDLPFRKSNGIEGYFASTGYHFWLAPLHGSSGGQHAGDSDGLRFCVQEIQV